MAIDVKMSKEVLVYAPKMNEKVATWGVYALPRLWREKGGELVVRFNGEEDCADTDRMFVLPNLFFRSFDEGESWEIVENGEEIYDISVWTGINPPYLTLKNGKKIAVKSKKGCKSIKGIPCKAEFIPPNKEGIVRVYEYKDIPEECKGIFLEIVEPNGDISQTPINYDFPERGVHVNAQALVENITVPVFKPVEELIQPYIFKSPYFSGLTELPDGTLLAVCGGQNPSVTDRFCTDVYLVESLDGGVTWKKRATIADGNDGCVPFGYGGDGHELSLTRAENGDLLCVMRMEMSVCEEGVEPPMFDAMLSISSDNGYTWSQPKAVADSSVTPHVIALKDGIVVMIYGRPGVHFKVSQNNGKTWSESYSIIGKTLEEELKAGRSLGDIKYFDTSSYSNTFVEKVSDDTVIVLYNDMKYDDGTGRPTKAGLVKKITVKKV